ncbi:MAG TPA: M48 family metalloprotease [Chloroflexota bacterium]
MRLNPFAFPSETDSRFALLIVAVLGSTTFVYNWLASTLPVYRDFTISTATGCSGVMARAASELQRAAADPLSDQGSQFAATRASIDCLAGYQRTVALWSLSGVVVVAIVALALYTLAPRWIRRRRHLVELDPIDGENVIAELEVLTSVAGVGRKPRFLAARGSRSAGAQVFGTAGQRTVALDEGLVTLAYTDPRHFRAVLLHELAHVRNADVDKTYLTVAIVLAFLAVALVPLAITLVGDSASIIASLIARVAVLVGLVALTGAAVLRARESYADVRASTWGDAAGGLDSVLGQMPSETSMWQRVLRVHPSPTRRRAILANTAALFRLGNLEAFAAAVAAALVLPRLVTILGGLLANSDQAILPTIASGFVIGPLLVGIVGVGIWRATFSSLVARTPLPACWPIAVSLAAGLVLGLFLGFDDAISLPLNPAAVIGIRILWAAVATVALFALLLWIVTGARYWLTLALTAAAPRRFYVSGLVIAGLVASGVIGILFFLELVGRTLLVNAGFSPGVVVGAMMLGIGAAGTLVIEQFPVVSMAVLALVWAYPLLGMYAVARANSGKVSRWALLDGALPVETIPVRVGLRPIVLTILIALLVDIVILVALDLQWRSQSAAFRNAVANKIAYFDDQVNATLLVEAIVAFIVALQVPGPRVLFALMASFVFGWLSTLSMHILLVVFGSTTDASFVLITAARIVGYGALIALVASGLAALVAKCWPRRPPAGAQAVQQLG